MKKRSKSLPTLKLLLLLLTLSTTACSSPLMIEQKEQFLQKLRTKNIAVLFYGDNQSPEYQSFEQIIPSSSQLFDGMEFVYVPASKFKLNRPNPSLSIYRKIGGGDWQLYKGNFDRVDMDKWIQHNIMDPLKELTVQNLEKMFRDGEPSFILLGYGEFQLIRTKVYVGEFCHFKQIKCWKVEPASPIYSVVAKLMGIQKHDFGESKLAFYNPQSERLQLYTKDIWKLKRQQLLQMYEGRQGIIHSQSPEGEIQIELHYQEDSQEI